MDSFFNIIVKLYGPIVISIILLSLLFTLRKNEKRDGKKAAIPINILGIIQFELPLTRVQIRFVIVLASIVSLLSYLIYDFSVFFPRELEMEVFYDPEGLQKSLKEFDQEELKKLRIIDNYEKYQSVYYDDLDKEIKSMLSLDKFFSLKDGIVHSEGDTDFLVKKIEGIHNYYVEKSDGKLKHILERPQKKSISFISFFEKVNSNNDYLKPSVFDIFIKRRIIIKPMFKQIIAENYKSAGVIFHHVVYGAMRIDILPFPKFSNTIYLFEIKNVGCIPIAYAVYKKK